MEKMARKELLIDVPGKGTCLIEKMASPAGSDSIDENKPECREFLINISGEGTCQIKNMVYPAASDSTEIKLECKELVIDIPAKRASHAATDIIEGIMEDVEPARWPDCCIYKVPKKLRDVNKKAYSPKLISIGPLHHGQKELKEMELQKKRYFKKFFDRERTREFTPKDLASIIDTDKEKKIRHCYAADTSKFSSKEFINMILLDAIFIIELFLRNATWSNHGPVHDLVASEQPNLLEQTKKSNDATIKPSQANGSQQQHKGADIAADSAPASQGEADSSQDKDVADYMFREKWLSYNLKQELLLFENQLPFFILEKLWDESNCYKGDQGKTTSFLTLAFAYFYELHPEHKQKPSRKNLKCFDDVLRRCTNSGKEVKDVKQHFSDLQNYTGQSREKIKHFTDMLRYFFYSPEPKEADGKCMQVKKFTYELQNIICFCSEDESEDGGFIEHLYSATQLDEAGVKFKRVKHKPLLDIKFKKNLCLECCPFLNCSWLLNCLPCFTCFKIMQPFLEVPTFEVNDETECVFRNLMAFEQCHSSPDPFICNYILLLDRFINSKEDVDLLVNEKVIVNFLGSNKRVASLVNDLCLEIVEPEKSRYMDLSKRLNKHYGNCWNKHMAKLSRIYFGDFWRGAATVVGLGLLVFTLWNYHRLLIKGQKF